MFPNCSNTTSSPEDGLDCTRTTDFSVRTTQSERHFAPTKERETSISEWLWKTTPLVLICVGLVGNILTIKVFLRMGLRRQPTLMFLLFLAFTDSVVLLSVLPKYWMQYTFDFDLRLLSNSNCKLYYFVVYLSMQYSSWILVGVSIERAVKTYFPLRYKHIYTTKRVVKGLFMTLFILCCINMHFFFTNGINEYTEDACGSLSPEYLYFDEYIFVYIDMAVSNLVPFLIMFACNILIIRILRKVQKQRPTMMHDLYVHRANSFTIKMTMMIVICMAYFLLAMTPFTTFFIVESYLRPGYKEANNYVALARLDLIWTVCYLIGLTNFCVNFFLYTAMNDRFSKEFRAMTRCQPSSRQVSIYTTGQSTKIRRTESTHLRRMTEEASPGIESSLTEYTP